MSKRDDTRISGGGGLGTSLLSERDRRQLVAQVNSGEIVKRDDGLVTDKEGRRRFHGAFTGGYSAGYFNTVGSAEGWTPSTFVSSRNNRASRREQTPQEYMDDEDGETIGGRMAVRSEYSVGVAPSRSAAAAVSDSRNRITTSMPPDQRRTRDSMTPVTPAQASSSSFARQEVVDLVPRDLIAPVRDSVGKRLLRAMGWREGQGVGPKERAPLRGRVMGDGKLDPHAAGHRFTPGDTTVRVATPMTGVFGLGYQPDRTMSMNSTSSFSSSSSAQHDARKASRFASVVDHGEIDEEDDDESMVYHSEDKSAYAQILDSGVRESSSSSSSRNNRPGYAMERRGRGVANMSRQSSLVSLLDSLVLATGTGVTPSRVITPPNVPRDFRPKPDLEEYSGSGNGSSSASQPDRLMQQQMNARDRGLVLGEKPSMLPPPSQASSLLHPMSPVNPMVKVPGSLASRFSKGASSSVFMPPRQDGEGIDDRTAIGEGSGNSGGGVVGRRSGLQLNSSSQQDDSSSNAHEPIVVPKRSNAPKVQRTTSVWHTEKLLCRRFDVPQPKHTVDQLNQQQQHHQQVHGQQYQQQYQKQHQQQQHQQHRTAPDPEVQRAPSGGQNNNNNKNGIIVPPAFKLAETSLFNAVFNTGGDSSSEDDDSDSDTDQPPIINHNANNNKDNNVDNNYNKISPIAQAGPNGNTPQPVFAKPRERLSWMSGPVDSDEGNNTPQVPPTVAQKQQQLAMVQPPASLPLSSPNANNVGDDSQGIAQRLADEHQQQRPGVVRAQPTPDMPGWLQRAVHERTKSSGLDSESAIEVDSSSVHHDYSQGKKRKHSSSSNRSKHHRHRRERSEDSGSSDNSNDRHRHQHWRSVSTDGRGDGSKKKKKSHRREREHGRGRDRYRSDEREHGGRREEGDDDRGRDGHGKKKVKKSNKSYKKEKHSKAHMSSSRRARARSRS